MGSTGRGRNVVAPPYVPWSWLFTAVRPDLSRLPTGHAIATDWFFGGSAPAPTQIQYSWLRPPVRFRPDSPINTATISMQAGGAVRAVNATNRDEFTEHAYATTLDTATIADPAALAAFVVDVYAVDPPRQRVPDLTFVLNTRSTTQRQLILEREIGDRIQIVGTPATWPQGTTSLVIEGIRHQIAADARVVIWATTPVIGATPGDPGPWFRSDESLTSGPDDVPF